MSDPDEPKAPQPPALIEYPTHYTFKAMGLAGPGFRELVRGIVAAVVGELEHGAITERPSSAGKYLSLSVHVYLQSEDQRRAVYEAFHKEKAIVWYV